MTGTRPKMALFAVGCFVVSALACHAESPAVKNCTWCHGTSAQGYTPAPRLAGQRSQYLENQLAGFRTHARDNPLSQQYMWDAAANLSPQSARDLATYFSTLPPRAAGDGDVEPVATGRAIYQLGCRTPISWLALFVMGRMQKGLVKFPLGRAGLFIFEKDARAVGPRISHRLRATDAGHREQIVAEPNRGARVIPQFCQVTTDCACPRWAGSRGGRIPVLPSTGHQNICENSFAARSTNRAAPSGPAARRSTEGRAKQ